MALSRLTNQHDFLLFYNESVKMFLSMSDNIFCKAAIFSPLGALVDFLPTFLLMLTRNSLLTSQIVTADELHFKKYWTWWEGFIFSIVSYMMVAIKTRNLTYDTKIKSKSKDLSEHMQKSNQQCIMELFC